MVSFERPVLLLGILSSSVSGEHSGGTSWRHTQPLWPGSGSSKSSVLPPPWPRHPPLPGCSQQPPLGLPASSLAPPNSKAWALVLGAVALSPHRLCLLRVLCLEGRNSRCYQVPRLPKLAQMPVPGALPDFPTRGGTFPLLGSHSTQCKSSLIGHLCRGSQPGPFQPGISSGQHNVNE